MLEALTKLFTETLKLSADVWLIICLAVLVVAFAVPLIAGLVAGRLKAVKTVMKSAIAHPQTAVAAMKRMPASIKAQYKNARMGNLRPSMLVTEQMCVAEPYKRSLISKVWISTLAATVVCSGIAYFSAPTVLENGASALVISPLTVFIFGGLLTAIGGIIGKCVYGGAVKTYEKFIPVLDGDQVKGAEPAAAQAAQQPAYSEPQAAYAEPQAAYSEPQTAYAEAQPVYEEQPQQVYAEPQAAYAEPQQTAYAEARPVYEEQPQVVNVAPQESDEEIRRKAREEALAQARAQQQQQQAQAAAQQQAAQQQAAQKQAAPAGGTSADDVIAQIEKIDRDGAPRETMREVATLLQRERAKPENKTPEQQKKLNEALSKLLKAMSAASRK
ncbi:hypothetical protein [Anaerocaecibacter muris]|uniref:hypothetical protein n=1 Tax=Anaerocaecibacter muris TaxID=2941513 RepID=UPI003F690B94